MSMKPGFDSQIDYNYIVVYSKLIAYILLIQWSGYITYKHEAWVRFPDSIWGDLAQMVRASHL